MGESRFFAAEAMDDRVFLEVIFKNVDFPFDGRDAVEDPLCDALEAAGIGTVTGGGSGPDNCNIDVEVTDLQEGLAVIRRTLRELSCAPSTRIRQYQPERVDYKLE